MLTAMQSDRNPQPSSSVDAMPSVRTFDSGSLFGKEHEIRIAHDGQEYRLRVTRNGKLILTK